MRAYYASQISEHMARTPEGFLICYGVPIARTGVQDYLGAELKLNGDLASRIVPVHRYPADVFDARALASFEGKPVTDNHPPETVRPDNISRFLKGVATNVRQGKDVDSECVVADLIIYDAVLIAEVEAGKREVSCGYDCVYEQNDKGELCQRKIEGNHVAVVGAGRAGGKVAIKDEKPQTNPERSFKRMGKKTNGGNPLAAVARLFPLFSKDAAPNDISDAVDELVDSIMEAQKGSDAPPAVPAQQPAPDRPAETTTAETKDDPVATALQQIMATLQGINTRLDQLEAGKSAPTDGLSALEDELSGEETVTVPVEKMSEEPKAADEAGTEGSPSTADTDGVENPISNADRKAVLDEIRLLKPIIAGIKDEKARVQVADSMARVYRQALGMTAVKSVAGAAAARVNGYAGILNTVQTKVQQRDSKPDAATVSDESLGREIAKKFNPHYKDIK